MATRILLIEDDPHIADVVVFLMSQPGRVYNRDQLMQAMYADQTEVNDRAVDQSVKRLRSNICRLRSEFQGIETVYGLGYRLV